MVGDHSWQADEKTESQYLTAVYAYETKKLW
jgi:hypothetical protein